MLPCGGISNDTYGWISAPDRDGDGFYDYNLRCQWIVEVQASKQIKYQVLYVLLAPCDDEDYVGVSLYPEYKRVRYFRFLQRLSVIFGFRRDCP